MLVVEIRTVGVLVLDRRMRVPLEFFLLRSASVNERRFMSRCTTFHAEATRLAAPWGQGRQEAVSERAETWHPACSVDGR